MCGIFGTFSTFDTYSVMNQPFDPLPYIPQNADVEFDLYVSPDYFP